MAGPELRSRNWFGKKDLDGFAHRSWLKTEGWRDVMFDGARGMWGQVELGSGTDNWRYWAELRAGRISEEEWCEIESCISRSAGHCMVMGTASTMASMAEALGMTLPGNAAIPASDSRRMALA